MYVECRYNYSEEHITYCDVKHTPQTKQEFSLMKYYSRFISYLIALISLK